MSTAKWLNSSDDAASSNDPYPCGANCTGKNLTGEDGQWFASIASGGTTVRVRGVGLLCPDNGAAMRLRLVNVDGTQILAECEPKNDSYAECVTPRMAPLSAPQPLAFSFEWTASGGGQCRLPLDESSLFLLYPDPLFADFDVAGDDSQTVTINGRGLSLGYAVDELTVTVFAAAGGPDRSNATGCALISITEDRIVCRADDGSPGRVLDRVRVTIGETLAFDLNASSGGYDDVAFVEPTASSPYHVYDAWELVKIAGFVIVVVLLFAHFVGLVAICWKMDTIQHGNDYENELLEEFD